MRIDLTLSHKCIEPQQTEGIRSPDGQKGPILEHCILPGTEHIYLWVGLPLHSPPTHTHTHTLPKLYILSCIFYNFPH